MGSFRKVSSVWENAESVERDASGSAGEVGGSVICGSDGVVGRSGSMGFSIEFMNSRSRSFSASSWVVRTELPPAFQIPSTRVARWNTLGFWGSGDSNLSVLAFQNIGVGAAGNPNSSTRLGVRVGVLFVSGASRRRSGLAIGWVKVSYT